jgi:hypothetical protein
MPGEGLTGPLSGKVPDTAGTICFGRLSDYVKTRLETLQAAVTKYQKALENLTAMNEELRSLPPSDRLTDVLELNETTVATTRRLLDTATERLGQEQRRLDHAAAGAGLMSPQAM